MILALVFMFLPFQRKVGDWIDRFFYMERVRFRAKLSEFGRTLTELVDLGEVAKTTVQFIIQTFHVDHVAFFFLKEDGDEYREIFGTLLREEKKYSSQSPFANKIESHRRPIDLEHLRKDGGGVEEIDDLVERGWVVVAPVLLKEKLAGFLLLGKKRSCPQSQQQPSFREEAFPFL